MRCVCVPMKVSVLKEVRSCSCFFSWLLRKLGFESKFWSGFQWAESLGVQAASGAYEGL